MINLCRLSLPLMLTLVATGCSSIHNSIGPEQQRSDLRDSVDAPFQLSEGESPFCNVPPMQIPETPKLVTAPEPFSAKLYFLLDKTEFTQESKVESQDIYQEILDREFSEITISGPQFFLRFQLNGNSGKDAAMVDEAEEQTTTARRSVV